MSWIKLDGGGWSWLEVDGAGWRWVHGLAILNNVFFTQSSKLIKVFKVLNSFSLMIEILIVQYFSISTSDLYNSSRWTFR